MNRPRKGPRSLSGNRGSKENQTAENYHGLDLSANRDALAKFLLEQKPAGGPAFWAFSIATADDCPSWDFRQSFFGSYESCVALAVVALGLMADAGLLWKARVERYQGADAYRFLHESMAYEARYQAERQAEPNN